jgi:hypothetical protein
MVTNLYSLAISIDESKRQATDNKGDRPARSRSPVFIHLGIEKDVNRRYVRYFGRSWSDSFDACGLVRQLSVVLDVCLVQLAIR